MNAIYYARVLAALEEARETINRNGLPAAQAAKDQPLFTELYVLMETIETKMRFVFDRAPERLSPA